MGKLTRIYVDNANIKNEIVICTRKNEKISNLTEKFISAINN